ncbi:MAG: hypothetical protein U0X93_14070 [Anaerolineales bacterium]
MIDSTLDILARAQSESTLPLAAIRWRGRYALVVQECRRCVAG